FGLALAAVSCSRPVSLATFEERHSASIAVVRAGGVLLREFFPPPPCLRRTAPVALRALFATAVRGRRAVLLLLPAPPRRARPPLHLIAPQADWAARPTSSLCCTPWRDDIEGRAMPSLHTGRDAATPLLRCPFREPKNEYDEMLLLLENLPGDGSRLWHSLKGIEVMLEKGGFNNLPTRFVSAALKSQNQQNRRGYSKNRTGPTTYYVFENDAQRLEARRSKLLFDTPKSQFGSGLGVMSIEEGYFTAYRYTFLRKYLGSSSSTSSTGDEAARGTGEQGHASTAGATSTSTAGNETARDTALGERGNEAMSSTADEVFWGGVEEGALAAGRQSNRVLHCSAWTSVPYVQTETISTRKRKRGATPDLVGERVVHAAHGSGVNVTQIGELCDQLGLVRSGNKGLLGMVKKRKEYVSEAAEEEMRKNRIEHNKEVRRRHGSSADIKFTDASGKSHSFAAGPACADGAGETRSYNLTHKPLMIKHHQKSCVLCQRAVSKLIVDGTRAQDITADDLQHEGRCYRNTALSPAQAEESALEELAEMLLIDPKTNEFRSDDEAILVLQVVTDGDTKGAKRFINKQVSLVPSFAGKAEQVPDIGHFVKAINNAFYKLKETSPELGGTSLLDAPRIKVMCSDVSKNIRRYGEKVSELDKGLADYQEQKEKLRDAALNDIDAIVPHHCGDHSSCGDQCKYKEIENSYISKYKESPPAGREGLNPENKEDRAKIAKLYEADIKSDYAKEARFRGATMSMSKAGQAKVKKVISQRLDKSNIDRVSETLSSNDCEGFFNMLTKYSHGKRIYYGQADSWQCFGKLVAGRKSNDRFEDEVQSLAGMVSTYVRDTQVVKCLRIKDKKRAREQSDKCKDRRKVHQMAKLKASQKSLSLPGRHKSNTLNAKDNCKSAPEEPPKKKKKRRTRCKNCKDFHDGECPWPAGVNPDSVKPKSKTQLKEERLQKEKKERMMSSFGRKYTVTNNELKGNRLDGNALSQANDEVQSVPGAQIPFAIAIAGWCWFGAG
ncbi:hypothetical protein THAOC_35133, partial [Thalassiosira oceanica]